MIHFDETSKIKRSMSCKLTTFICKLFFTLFSILKSIIFILVTNISIYTQLFLIYLFYSYFLKYYVPKIRVTKPGARKIWNWWGVVWVMLWSSASNDVAQKVEFFNTSKDFQARLMSFLILQVMDRFQTQCS